MKHLLLAILLLSTSMGQALSQTPPTTKLSQECNEVGNYINERANQVYNALYVLYNGIGDKKKEAYDVFFIDALKDILNTNYKNTLKERLDYYEIALEAFAKEDETIRTVRFNRTYSTYKMNDYKFQVWAFNTLISKNFCKKAVPYEYHCKKPLIDLIDYVKRQQFITYYSGKVSTLLPQEVKAVLTQSKYSKGLLIALKKLAALSPSADSTVTFHKILEDSFSFLPENEKYEALWNTLGFYGTRGASVTNYAKVFNTSNFGLPLALTAEVFNRVHYLNAEKVQASHLATLPSFKKNSCIYGKAYHFWMAARLANKLRYTDKYPAEEAFATAYTTGLMYNFFGSGAPQRKSQLYPGSIETTYLKSIRHSLLFQALGAYFGATHKYGEMVDIDVDELYLQMTKELIPIKHYPKKNPMANLEQFLNVTGSNQLFNSLMQEIKEKNI